MPAQVALWLATTLKPCAAFRQLSEVKHVPAAPRIEPGTYLSVLFAEVVVIQLGISNP